MVLFSKLPAYTGPVAVGTAMPTFSTTLADGSHFDQDSLRGEQNTVLLFFRGKW
jgi:peroxiredoxin